MDKLKNIMIDDTSYEISKTLKNINLDGVQYSIEIPIPEIEFSILQGNGASSLWGSSCSANTIIASMGAIGSVSSNKFVISKDGHYYISTSSSSTGTGGLTQKLIINGSSQSVGSSYKVERDCYIGDTIQYDVSKGGGTNVVSCSALMAIVKISDLE